VVAVPDRSGNDGTAEQAVALKAEQEVRDAMRRLGSDQSAADAQRGEVRLVAGALGELGGALDQTLGVERGADDGLGVEVDYGTLLLRDSSAGKVACDCGVLQVTAVPTRTGLELFAISARNAPITGIP